MAEQFARGVNGIDFCYETFGDPAHEPLLLIMGLGAPLTWWDVEFCAELAGRGFYVVRFDNRDCGRSSWLDGRVDLCLAVLLRRSPYTLEDMADDAAGLLDHLGLAQANVVGTSMGGMIAQLLAIRHPRRVRTLTSIMSTTGNKFVGRPSLTGWKALLTAAPPEREAYLDHQVRTFTTLQSPGYPIDEQRVRMRSALSYDRGLNASGRARHLAAILAAPDRTPKLRELRMPVTVIHGADDHLVGVSGGLATARAIPGAELHVINGLGHELPPALWTRYADFIEHTAQRRVPV